MCRLFASEAQCGERWIVRQAELRSQPVIERAGRGVTDAGIGEEGGESWQGETVQYLRARPVVGQIKPGMAQRTDVCADMYEACRKPTMAQQTTQQRKRESSILKRSMTVGPHAIAVANEGSQRIQLAWQLCNSAWASAMAARHEHL